MDAATMRGRVETELKDTGNARWSDAELDRCIARAVEEYSEANPLLAYVDKAGTTSRWYDISATAGYLRCEAVEYPIDDTDGPLYRLFREERNAKKVYVMGEAPVVGENIRFWYAKMHILDGASSTIPVEHEHIIVMGGEVYALEVMTAYTVDRLNLSGWTPRQFREIWERRLKRYRDILEGLRLTRVSSLGGAMVAWNGTV